MVRLVRAAAFIFQYALSDLFPISFYGRNLRERLGSLLHTLKGSLSALLNVATLAILLVTVTVVAGLYFGTSEWVRELVSQNAMARTVTLTSTMGSRGDGSLFSEAELDKFRTLAFPGRESSPISSVHGWNPVITFSFYKNDGTLDQEIVHGRTADLNDPILSQIEDVKGQRLTGAEINGSGAGQIFITSSLLTSLGYHTASRGSRAVWPAEIEVKYANLAARVKIVAVCDWLPGGDFVITSQFNRLFNDKQWNPFPKYQTAKYGKFSSEAEAKALIEVVQDFLSASTVNMSAAPVPVVRGDGEYWIQFRLLEEPWPKSKWKRGFTAMLSGHPGVDPLNFSSSFNSPVQSDIRAFETIKVGSLKASVEVHKLADVPDVVDALKDLGYHGGDGVKQRALLVTQIQSLGELVLEAVVWTVGSLSVISIALSFFQAVQRRIPQLAILKAFGTRSRLVMMIYVVEAVLIWAIALVVASGVTESLANLANAKLIDVFTEQGLQPASESTVNLVNISNSLSIVVALSTLALCVIATLTGGYAGVRVQPAEAFRQ